VFDVKAENLTSFIDALQIIETIKGEYDQLAVSIITRKEVHFGKPKFEYPCSYKK